jgi:hypothetical protein
MWKGRGTTSVGKVDKQRLKTIVAEPIQGVPPQVTREEPLVLR